MTSAKLVTQEFDTDLHFNFGSEVPIQYIQDAYISPATILNACIPASEFRFMAGNENCGRLIWTDGTFKFDGDADASALQFFNCLKSHIDEYIKSELSKQEISGK